jgi:catechol 2,3-dioxygenase-like lactoylglutathione lyase family enzyme
MLLSPRLAFLPVVAFLAASQPASAQRGPRGDVSFGHIHLNSADPDKAIAFWTDLIGATDYSRGPVKGVIMAGALILFTKSSPSAPSTGGTVDRIDLHVPDLQPFVEKLAKTPYKSFQPVAGGPQLMIDGPDGVRIELNEDNELYNPLEFQYLHFSSPHAAEMQAWYGKIFNARAGGDEKLATSRLPGGVLVFGQADAAAPTAGRAIDHIAFEIKGLEAFCAKLAAEGIKFDEPYHSVPDMKMSAAFITDPWGTRIELTEGLSH